MYLEVVHGASFIAGLSMPYGSKALLHFISMPSILEPRSCKYVRKFSLCTSQDFSSTVHSNSCHLDKDVGKVLWHSFASTFTFYVPIFVEDGI